MKSSSIVREVSTCRKTRHFSLIDVAHIRELAENDGMPNFRILQIVTSQPTLQSSNPMLHIRPVHSKFSHAGTPASNRWLNRRLSALFLFFAIIGFTSASVIARAFLPAPEITRARTTSAPDNSRSSVEPFRSLAVDGTEVELAKSTAAVFTVVCFIGNDCPLVKLYIQRLNELAEQLEPRGVKFLAINSNRQDTEERIRAFCAEHAVSFPVIADPFHKLADQFQAKRTPEVFVLDQGLSVCYHGRIDDQYSPGVSRHEARRRDLEIALEECLSGGRVSVDRTSAVGCLIGRVIDSNATVETEVAPQSDLMVPTFSEHVAAIVYRHCGECHRPNDIGPFSLIDYEDVRGWGAMMVEVIDNGIMPPWHANPEHGQFANHREMPEADKQLIRDWVAAGGPAGDLELVPAAPEAAPEWMLPREPELVVSMASTEFQVPSSGTVDYKYFVVDPQLTEDRWVSAAQIVPGNRSVVHHSIVFIRPPEGEDVSGQGWLAAYVPGQRPLPYPDGYARRIPAGSKFVFQQHYTPNGVPQGDITKIGLVFADPEAITHQVDTLVALNQTFEIPPYEENFLVEGTLKRIPQQATMLGLSPHMHYRGKAFKLTAISDVPDADHQVILDVPRYDFNWQHVYAFADPLRLKGIARIDFVAAFDNSEKNPANPDPSRTVTWGDQSWEEMAIVYFDVAWEIRPDSSPDAKPAKPEVEVKSNVDEANQSAEEIERQVNEFFERFNHAGKDSIPKQALPESIRRFGRLDANDDGEISRDEVREAFRQRARIRRRATE